MYIIHREATLYHIFWNTEMIKYLSRKPIDTVFMNASPGHPGAITIRVISRPSPTLFTYHCGSLILFKILVFRCDKVILYIPFVLSYRFEHRIYSTLLIFKKILPALIRLSLLKIKDNLYACTLITRLDWFHFKDEFILKCLQILIDTFNIYQKRKGKGGGEKRKYVVRINIDKE